MTSNKYYTGIIVRVLLIVLTALLLAFLSYKTNYLYSILVMALLVISETWALIRYILRRRDDIKRMLEYIKENNPTLYFSQSRNYPFNELGYFLNEIGDIVREVRIEKENQFQYMKYIVQHVGTGLLSFDKYGNVDIINQAAKDLLCVSEINSIDTLESVHRGMPEILKNLKAGEQKVITMKSESRLQQLAIRASVFKIGDKDIRLISLQDIKNELDEKEMEAWQKLIRVLTHEIINSVTPVTTLTSTISGFFKKDGQIIPSTELSDENIRETLTGLGLIEDRGKNLIGFVSKFRSLTKLPPPKFLQTSPCSKGYPSL
jgi:nitrogen fixation/metabolism regulation signal transduction histidine kinase